MKLRGWGLAAIVLPALMAASGCHSLHIETKVENRTGSEIRLLEVDYPSAGTSTIASSCAERVC